MEGPVAWLGQPQSHPTAATNVLAAGLYIITVVVLFVGAAFHAAENVWRKSRNVSKVRDRNALLCLPTFLSICQGRAVLACCLLYSSQA